MKYRKRGLIRPVILGGDACDLCYRGSWFESRLGHYLERVFVSSSKKKTFRVLSQLGHSRSFQSFYNSLFFENPTVQRYCMQPRILTPS